MRRIRESLRHLALQTRQADIEPSLQEERSVRLAKIHFGIDGHICGDPDMHLAARMFQSTDEARRPSRSKQLLRISPFSRRARKRKLDVQAAIGAMGRAAIAAACSVSFRCVQYFFRLCHDVFPF